jgi:WD40 repeat protein
MAPLAAAEGLLSFEKHAVNRLSINARRTATCWLSFCLGAIAGTCNSTDSAAAEPLILRAARVIECTTGETGQPAVVSGVALSPDGATVAAATDDHSVTLWDAATSELRCRLTAHADWVRSVDALPGGPLLASGACDRTLCLWDATDEHALQLQLPACAGGVAAVRVHPNGQQVAVAGFADTLKIVNASTGQIVQQFDCDIPAQCAVAFSPDGTRLAAAGNFGRIRIWNLQTLAHERDVETDGRRLRALAFSPDGRRLAAGGDGPLLRLVDVASGHTAATLSARPAKVFAMTFLDGDRLAAAGSDNRIRVWNVTDGQVHMELVGHTGTIAALAADRTGATLASGSFDTTVRIWKLDERRIEAAAEFPSPRPVR